MSVSREITVICDECGADGPTDWWVTLARQQARAEGWRVGLPGGTLPGGRDLCPECRVLPSGPSR